MSLRPTSFKREEGYELRTYTNVTWISVVVKGTDVQDAASRAFPILYSYIREHRFPMTVPVTVQPGERGTVVSFFLRGAPNVYGNEDVRVRHQATFTVAVSSFGGWTTPESVKSQVARLRDLLKKDDVDARPEHIISVYSSPFQPIFRKNEVWIPLSDAEYEGTAVPVPDPDWVFFLTCLNAFAFVIHVVSASLGTALVKRGNPLVPAIAPFFEYKTDGGVDFFVPRPRTIFTIGSLTGLLLFAWITAAFHLVYVLQLYSPEFRYRQVRILGGGGTNPIRWIEYSITAGIMASLANLNIGISDFYLFLKVICSNIAVQMIGFILELLDHRNPLHLRVAGILWNQATILNMINVFILLFQIFESDVKSDAFYYNIIPYSVLFQSFGAVAWADFKKYGPFAKTEYTEAWYIGLSLGTKFAVFFLGFSTYRGLEEDRGFAAKTYGVNWTAVRYVASYGPLSLMVIAAAIEYRRAKNAVQIRGVARSSPLNTALVLKSASFRL